MPEPETTAPSRRLLDEIAERRADTEFRDRLQQRVTEDAAILARMADERDPLVPPYCYLDPDLLEHRARWHHWCVDQYIDVLLPNVKWSWSVEDFAVVDVTPSLDCDRCGTHGHWTDGMWRSA